MEATGASGIASKEARKEVGGGGSWMNGTVTVKEWLWVGKGDLSGEMLVIWVKVDGAGIGRERERESLIIYEDDKTREMSWVDSTRSLSLSLIYIYIYIFYIVVSRQKEVKKKREIQEF